MPKFKVLVTRQLPGKGLEKLRKIAEIDINTEERVLTRDEFMERVKGKDGILSVLTDKIDAEIMDCERRLKVVSNCAVGFDNIDLKSATERGIYVTNTPEVLTETVADLTWALILGVSRRLVEADLLIRSGKWNGWSPTLMLGSDVYGKTLGIIGLGRIGRAVAIRARGFKMRLLYNSTKRNEELERELGLSYVSFEKLLKDADYITIHVPLAPSTYHMIGEKELGLMKPTAYLINTSRGKVVDEKALGDALRNRIVAGAGLDVFEEEPIDSKSLLINQSNTILLPHIGSGTLETRTAMVNISIENLLKVLQRKVPPNLVNKDVLIIRPLV
ncbi:MAG: D-glycerate dehydrogenase [Candidatus Bathyarchaeota archaeon]